MWYNSPLQRSALQSVCSLVSCWDASPSPLGRRRRGGIQSWKGRSGWRCQASWGAGHEVQCLTKNQTWLLHEHVNLNVDFTWHALSARQGLPAPRAVAKLATGLGVGVFQLRLPGVGRCSRAWRLGVVRWSNRDAILVTLIKKSLLISNNHLYWQFISYHNRRIAVRWRVQGHHLRVAWLVALALGGQREDVRGGDGKKKKTEDNHLERRVKCNWLKILVLGIALICTHWRKKKQREREGKSKRERERE